MVGGSECESIRSGPSGVESHSKKRFMLTVRRQRAFCGKAQLEGDDTFGLPLVSLV